MAYETEKAERDFRMNPPQDAPGQGDNGWGDLFESMPIGSSSAEVMPQNQNIQLNTQQTITNQIPMSNNNQQTKPPVEDMVLEGVVLAGKGFFHYTKLLIDSFKNNTNGDWHKLGVRITKLSTIGALVGVLFCIIEKFSKQGNSPFDLIIGSLMSMVVGIALCMFYDSEESSSEDSNSYSQNNLNDTFEFDFDDVDNEESISINFNDEDDIEITDDFNIDFDFNEEEEFNINYTKLESDDFNVEEEVNNLPEITQGTQTRQYLYETFMKVLPLMSPNFSEMEIISDDSNEFFEFETLLRSSAYQVGTKDDSIPELETLYVNDFIYRLNCSRPVGIKEQAIADEIAKAYARDDNNRIIRYGCYATVETSVGKYTINIFKGSKLDKMGNIQVSAFISLGDVYSQIKDYICNPNIEMPFVWGINELGDAYYCDMKDNNSIIISGEPRGGKSWKGQSIIAQLAMFHSPKELEFYFFDGKDDASDYKYPARVLPHAKYFCGNMDKINEGLDKVIDMMINERGKKITDAGCINIKDYNRTHPNDKLPYVYVVIDELQSLMGHFVETNQKEEANKFKSYLSSMVSKLPYTGLRFVLFPHRIVNDIINKNTYSLVSCRAVVRQTNFDEIKNAMNITEKTFPYRLAQVGDMALKINEIAGGNVIYCHGEVLTKSNEGNRKLFDYIGGVWKKLEPDCKCISVNGSIGGHIGNFKYSSINSNKPARDNTNGEENFKYTGYTEGSLISDIPTGELDNEDYLDADSDFWSQFNQ